MMSAEDRDFGGKQQNAWGACSLFRAGIIVYSILFLGGWLRGSFLVGLVSTYWSVPNSLLLGFHVLAIKRKKVTMDRVK